MKDLKNKKIRAILFVFILLISTFLSMITLTENVNAVEINQHESATGTTYGQIYNSSLPQTKTYYYDNYTIGANDFNNPAWMVDGNDTKFASSNIGDTMNTQYLDSIAEDAIHGNITKVEVRWYRYGNRDGGSLREIQFQPWFDNGAQTGLTYYDTVFTTTMEWCDYKDITNDNQAPDPWTYNDITKLDAKIFSLNAYNDLIVYISRIELKVTYEDRFNITRTASESSEQNNIVFTTNQFEEYNDDATLKIPVSNSVQGILNVTNNTGGIEATEVDSMGELVNNTYYYDSANQFVYIRTVDLPGETSINWTVNCSYGAEFNLQIPRYLEVGDYFMSTGLIAVDGTPISGIVSETRVLQNGVDIINPIKWNCADGNYYCVFSTTAMPPGIYNISIEFTDSETGITFKNGSLLYLSADPPPDTYVQAHIFFSYYDNSTGLGLPSETFKLYVSDDTIINENDRVYQDEVISYTGDTLYYFVKDFFNHKVYPLSSSYQTLPVSSVSMFVDIPIDWYTFSVKNMNHSIVKMIITNDTKTVSEYLFPYEAYDWQLSEGEYNLTMEYYEPETGSYEETSYQNITVDDATYYWIRGYDLQDIVIEVRLVNTSLDSLEINIESYIDVVNSSVNSIETNIINVIELTESNITTLINNIQTTIDVIDSIVGYLNNTVWGQFVNINSTINAQTNAIVVQISNVETNLTTEINNVVVDISNLETVIEGQFNSLSLFVTNSESNLTNQINAVNVVINNVETNLSTQINSVQQTIINTMELEQNYNNLPGTISHWTFDETNGSGTTAIDHIGDHDGTFSVESRRSGRFGNCFEGDNSSVYVNCTNSDDFNFDSDEDFSISLWFKTSATKDPNILLCKKHSGGSTHIGYRFVLDAAGFIYGYISDGTTQVFPYALQDYRDGNWHHMVVTADRDGILKMYVDSIQTYSMSGGTWATVGDISNNYGLLIGQESYMLASRYFNGSIDDVRVFNIPLSHNQVQYLYNSSTSSDWLDWQFNQFNYMTQNITNIETEITTQISYVANQITNMETNVTSQFSIVTAQVTNLETNITNQVTIVNATVNNVNTNINTQINSVQTAITNTETNLSNQINEINIAISNTETNISNQINNINIAITNTETNITNQLNTIITDISNTNTSISTQANLIMNAITNTETNISTQLNSISTSIENSETNLTSQVNIVYNELTNVNSSIHGQLTSVSSQITNLNSSITQQYNNIEIMLTNTNTNMSNQINNVNIAISNTETNITTQLNAISTSIVNNKTDMINQINLIWNSLNNTESNIVTQINGVETTITTMHSNINTSFSYVLANISYVEVNITNLIEDMNATLLAKLISVLDNVSDAGTSVFDQVTTVLTNITQINTTLFNEIQQQALLVMINITEQTDITLSEIENLSEAVDSLITGNLTDLIADIYEDVTNISMNISLDLTEVYENLTMILDSIDLTELNISDMMTITLGDMNDTILQVWNDANNSFSELEQRSTVIFNFYNTNEGLGLDRETLRIYINGSRLIDNFYYCDNATSINLTIKDYYNFTLYQNNFTITAPYTFIDLGLTFHSWLFGDKNDAYYMISLLKEGGSRWWERGIVPMGEREFMIPSGNYTMRIYDPSYNELYNQTHTIDRSMVYIIQGTNLTTIISGQSVIIGQLLQLSADFDYALTPDMTTYCRNPPIIFSAFDPIGMLLGGNFIKLCPPINVLAQTRKTYDGNHTNTTPFIPGNGSLANGTITIVEDIIKFTSYGTLPTWVNISYLNGTQIQNTTYLPVDFDAGGYNLTITSDVNLHLERRTRFNQLKKFDWDYYPGIDNPGYITETSGQKRTGYYRGALEITNTMNTTWYDVYVRASYYFDENEEEQDKHQVDLSTVRVKDVDNNNRILDEGENFVAGGSGVEFKIQGSITPFETRSFLAEYYNTYSNTYHYGSDIIHIDSHQTNIRHDEKLYNYFKYTWINPYEKTYRGSLKFYFDFPVETAIEQNTAIVYDAGTETNITEFIISDQSLEIGNNAVGDVPPGGGKTYEVYFKMKTYPGQNPEDFHLDTPIVQAAGMPVSFFTILICIGLFLMIFGILLVGMREKKTHKDLGKGLAGMGFMIAIITWILSALGI